MNNLELNDQYCDGLSTGKKGSFLLNELIELNGNKIVGILRSMGKSPKVISKILKNREKKNIDNKKFTKGKKYLKTEL